MIDFCALTVTSDEDNNVSTTKNSYTKVNTKRKHIIFTYCQDNENGRS